MKTGKKGRGQGTSAPEDSCNQCIECDTFSDPREFIPLSQAEGQLTIGSVQYQADPGKKQEEGGMEPLADKEVKASGRAEETDQSME